MGINGFHPPLKMYTMDRTVRGTIHIWRGGTGVITWFSVAASMTTIYKHGSRAIWMLGAAHLIMYQWPYSLESDGRPNNIQPRLKGDTLISWHSRLPRHRQSRMHYNEVWTFLGILMYMSMGHTLLPRYVKTWKGLSLHSGKDHTGTSSPRTHGISEANGGRSEEDSINARRPPTAQIYVQPFRHGRWINHCLDT